MVDTPGGRATASALRDEWSVVEVMEISLDFDVQGMGWHPRARSRRKVRSLHADVNLQLTPPVLTGSPRLSWPFPKILAGINLAHRGGRRTLNID
jgi:hypothetical protein